MLAREGDRPVRRRVTTAESTPDAGFHVRLSNFEGPFDLLLQLIFGHRLDVTEVALHQVTDEFIAAPKAIGAQLELDETTAFLVVAATLLDLKAARLLPAGQVEDAEDLALLEVATRFAGCCSTARTSMSPRCSPSWREPRCAATPGRCRWRTGSLICSPGSVAGRRPRQFRADRRDRAVHLRPVPTVTVEHMHQRAPSR